MPKINDDVQIGRITLEDNEAALVFSETGMQIIVPTNTSNKEMPSHILLMTAVAMLINEGDDNLQILVQEKLKELSEKTTYYKNGSYVLQ